MKPLAIMPPPNSGSSLKSTTRTMAPRGGAKIKRAPPSKRTPTGVFGLKRKTPKESGPSLQKGEKYKGSLVTPSDNVVLHSYSSPPIPSACPLPNSRFTVVGVRKPEGGYEKALKPKLTPMEKEQAESSSQPLRIRSFRKPPIIR